MSTPDWVGPVARYMLEVGLRNTLKLSAIALVGSTLIGITLGTLLTIRFLPTRALIRLYIEIWRGLPILVTIFIVYFALPAVSPSAPVRRDHRRCDRADPLGQRSGGGDDAGSRPVDSTRAARGGVGARVRLGGPARVRDHAAGSSPAPSPAGRPAREHHPEHDHRADHRRAGAPRIGRAPGRAAHRSRASSTPSRSTAR